MSTSPHARDAAGILDELRSALASAADGAVGRVPIVEQLVEQSRQLLDMYVNALNQAKTADSLRLEFLFSQPEGFDLIVNGKSCSIASREQIDEAMIEAVAATGDKEIDDMLTRARTLEPWNKRTTDSPL